MMYKVICATAVAVASGVVAFWGVAAATGSDSDGGVRLSSLAQSGGISDNALAIIESRDGSFEPAKGGLPVAITQDNALRLAGGSLGFLNDGATSASAVLGRMTDGQYGTFHESDSSQGMTIDPRVKDRLIWLVEVRGFTMPEFGPLMDPVERKKLAPAVTGGSDALVYVDASSGDVLGAVQYSSHLDDNDLHAPKDTRRLKDAG